MSVAQTVLKDTFGYDAFRGQQQAVIDSVIAGADALVIMPTGGGKSLCYQIPSLVREGCGVVISPLIALMQDQVDALKELGIRAGFLNSTQAAADSYAIENALVTGELDLLYIAPERLSQPRTVNLLQQARISLFAIDEAHCVSQWGHDFRADYLRLHHLAEAFPSVPRMALTATADARTQQEIIERLCIQQAKAFVAGFDRPNICYQIELKQQPKQQLLRFIKERHSEDSGIVYCLSRKKTEDIAAWLTAQGFTALPYHAGMPYETRALHQQRFLREEKVIIVATIAFGMGIDKPDVRFVAHLDLPKSIEAYYQETGRAGRDAEPANAWMVYGLEDVIKLREMMGSAVGGTEEKNEFKRVEHQKLESMLGLCEITSCRRHALLHYFGDESPAQCGNCDMCKNPAETWDGTEASQKAISCAYRTDQRFGVNHLIDVLSGANTEKIKQFAHQKLSVYGIGKELNKVQWRSVYRQLIARNFLQVDFANFNRILLTENCRPILKGEASIELRKDVVQKTALRKSSANTKAILDQHKTDLWELLRECRLDLAQAKGVPPYVVFHDSVLMQMVEELPSSIAHFSRLSGVGQKKCDQYASAFIAVIQEYADKKKNSIMTSGELSPTVDETYRLISSGETPEAIATQRQLALSTIYTHISQLIRFSKVELSDVVKLTQSELHQIEGVFVECGLMDEMAKLKPAYDGLAEAYSYSVLRCVHADFVRRL
ncbi:ATP-dependent DNA helicase RecQ [gamma proteobacterium IMCC1989]|nr:ATP-dependent DNA helicase RecQ [gamma proteobacterium IMCC1989]